MSAPNSERKGAVSLPTDPIDDNHTVTSIDMILKGKLFPAEFKDIQEVVLDDEYLKTAAKLIRNVKENLKAKNKANIKEEQAYIAQNYSLDLNGIQKLAKDLWVSDQEEKRRAKFVKFNGIAKNTNYAAAL
jgi:hypothetical protein